MRVPITSNTIIELITIKMRLKTVSHFIWLYERSNLLFFSLMGFDIQNNYQSLFYRGTGNCVFLIVANLLIE